MSQSSEKARISLTDVGRVLEQLCMQWTVEIIHPAYGLSLTHQNELRCGADCTGTALGNV